MTTRNGQKVPESENIALNNDAASLEGTVFYAMDRSNMFYELTKLAHMLTLILMRRIKFYETASGNCPVKEFLESLDSKQAQKVTWVMHLVRDLPQPPNQYFKKLVGSDLWEVRTTYGGNAFRLLGFFDGDQLIVLTSGFTKKTQKTPKQEIDTAQARMKDYFQRKG